MRWRKEYESDAARKPDRHNGFIACLLINVILLLVSRPLLADATTPAALQFVALLLPWVVNIGVIIVALLLRPEIAVGYLMFFAVVIIGSIVLGVLFVASCVAGLVVGFILSPLGDIAAVALWIVFALCFVVGLIFAVGALLPSFRKWW